MHIPQTLLLQDYKNRLQKILYPGRNVSILKKILQEYKHTTVIKKNYLNYLGPRQKYFILKNVCIFNNVWKQLTC